jgi:1,4-dihydroxy-6-naphthoate synthase
MEVSVAHTPDADDAFMFYGIASGSIRSSLSVRHVIADIEALNHRAIRHELDVTAVSAHAFAYLEDYVILKSGGSFGLDYGPIVLAKKEMTIDQLARTKIAIPGRLTSAYLLLMLAIGKFDAREMPFDAVPDAVDSSEVDAGLVIHEAQITYDRRKFVKLIDLGKWWTKETGGLPVPLGINVASLRTMSRETIAEFSDMFTRSIAFGLDNIDRAVDYAMQYSRGQPKDTITKFVRMYVNDLTLDLGPSGRKAIEKMFEMAKDRGIIKNDVKVDVI